MTTNQKKADRPLLCTGAAGFIGFHVIRRLLADGRAVVGIDNLNSYYSVKLKLDRLQQLQDPRFRFLRLDLTNAAAVESLFQEQKPVGVIHLAAQAGVRYSLEQPQAYIDANVTGFLSILEACRRHAVEHLVFASSSSVYGATNGIPAREDQPTDAPLSLYAASKKANEVMAASYSHLFQIPATGLRFFTVYGPWGRPDMAMWKFAEAIQASKPVRLFNGGDMQRDFTYIDDAVEAVWQLLARPPNPARCELYNVGGGSPVELPRVIELLETELGRKAQLERTGMQPGDVRATFADPAKLKSATGFLPQTSIDTGIHEFLTWWKGYWKP